MVKSAGKARGRIWLLSTSSLWIAGFQGLFGDPCGVDASAITLREALSLKGPQIVLIDVSATSVEGRVREVLLQFRQWAPELRPIVISHENGADDHSIEELIRAGAKGYLSASASSEEFRVALENVRDGSLWAPRRVLSRLVQSGDGGPERPSSFGPAVGAGSGRGAAPTAKMVKFTPREDQVIQMLVGGRDNREIGAGLGIDPVTVKAHLGRMMRKAGVANRIELTMFALKRKAQRRSAEPGTLGPRGV